MSYIRQLTARVGLAELSVEEQQTLDTKLRALGYEPEQIAPPAAPAETDEQWLRPEAYSEVGGKREVAFSERELNAMIANNPDLAKKLAFDMSNNLLSSRLLVPVDPDFPILGGKTLRVAAGVALTVGHVEGDDVLGVVIGREGEVLAAARTVVGVPVLRDAPGVARRRALLPEETRVEGDGDVGNGGGAAAGGEGDGEKEGEGEGGDS